MEPALTVARKWTELLDAESFGELPAMLHPDCVYESPKGTVTGAREIINTYRRNAEWAHETFDHISWGSEMVQEPDGCIRITFTDTTRHRGVDHVYRCQQVIRVDAKQRIDRIEHVAIASEEQALQEFFDGVGVRRG